jgi:hypothetical protein
MVCCNLLNIDLLQLRRSPLLPGFKHDFGNLLHLQSPLETIGPKSNSLLHSDLTTNIAQIAIILLRRRQFKDGGLPSIRSIFQDFRIKDLPPCSILSKKEQK